MQASWTHNFPPALPEQESGPRSRHTPTHTEPSQWRGTLFIDTQRKLNFYLRALWGRDFFLRPTAADHEGFRPYIEHHVFHLPDAVDDIGPVKGLELYRAMAAHMAAHVSYTRSALSAEELSPAQMFFIGLLEDARVEYQAIQAFPGLKQLWGTLLVTVQTRPLLPQTQV